MTLPLIVVAAGALVYVLAAACRSTGPAERE